MLGIDYHRNLRAQIEAIVDAGAFVVSASVGPTVDGESIPYVAGSGEDRALESIAQFAETHPTLLRRLIARVDAARRSPSRR